jgi:cyclopropane fatty-acyl-phospholipid synthase-like methyltransferase
LKDGSSMALHCITYENYPKTIEDIENVIHVSKVFFPGGRSPRVEEIFSSCRKYFDVEKMYTRRLDYKKTVLAWLERLLENEDQNIQKFGKDKFDFFKKAGFIYADLFNKRITSLAQFSMKKY